MNRIADTCPLTKSEGGLQSLHNTEDDTCNWMETTVTDYSKKQNI